MDLLTYILLKQEISTIATEGIQGAPGKSAYEIALEEGFEGSQQDWLASLVGPPGPPALFDIVKVNGIALEVDPTDNSVNIPIAGEQLGVVKSSVEDNRILVLEEGEMEVNSLNIDRLF